MKGGTWCGGQASRRWEELGAGCLAGPAAMASGLPVWGRRGRLAPYLFRAGRQLPMRAADPASGCGAQTRRPAGLVAWAEFPLVAATAGGGAGAPPRRSPLPRRAPSWGHHAHDWWRSVTCLALARVTRSTGDTPADGGKLATAGPPRPVTLPRVVVVCMIGPHGEPSPGGLVRPSPLVGVSTQWVHTVPPPPVGVGARQEHTHCTPLPPMLFCRTDQCVQLCTPIAPRCVSRPHGLCTWHGLRAPLPPSKPLTKGRPDPSHSFLHIMAETARCGGGHDRREHVAHQQVGREGEAMRVGGRRMPERRAWLLVRRVYQWVPGGRVATTPRGA